VVTGWRTACCDWCRTVLTVQEQIIHRWPASVALICNAFAAVAAPSPEPHCLGSALQVSEDLLTVLLPFLVSGLKASAARDIRAATLMVLTQLLARASLSKDFLAGEGPAAQPGCGSAAQC